MCNGDLRDGSWSRSAIRHPATAPTPTQVPLIHGIDVITNLEAQTEPYVEAFLLHCFGPNALKVYNGMEFACDEEHSLLEKLILEKII